jgi:uroporphyrin-3 C-methyltransferase/uroporphyrinogen III methyltransferase/synthase
MNDTSEANASRPPSPPSPSSQVSALGQAAPDTSDGLNVGGNRDAVRGRTDRDRASRQEVAGAGWLVGFLTVAGVASLLALGAAAWFGQERIGRVERDMVRRLQEAEIREQQLEQQSRLLGDTVRDQQAKAALLEAKLAESLGQQAQLRQLYDQMARSRGELMLADVESSIMIAAQQLQLGGNVQSALLALQDAEQVLARSNQPSMIGLRRVLARDIERLKAIPLADFAAAVSRLDALASVVDRLPMVSDATRSAPAKPPAEPETPSSSGLLLGLPQRVMRTGALGWDAFIAEMRQLVRVQRVDQPDALLLSPDQRFFARENLRLQLLNSRLNLPARNQSLFRADIARALESLDRWFDGSQASVVAASNSLKQLQAAPLTLEMPSLAETIAAVRAARAAGENR